MQCWLIASAIRAELVCPGHPLLMHWSQRLMTNFVRAYTGVTLVDSADLTDRVRVLVALEHTVTDGRIVSGQRKTVSKRFQFVEIDIDGTVTDPGSEPYLNYRPITETESSLLNAVPTDWTTSGIDDVARNWATANLAGPHFKK